MRIQLLYWRRHLLYDFGEIAACVSNAHPSRDRKLACEKHLQVKRDKAVRQQMFPFLYNENRSRMTTQIMQSLLQTLQTFVDSSKI